MQRSIWQRCGRARTGDSRTVCISYWNVEHLTDVRQEWLDTSRTMVIAACQKKGWLLSRLALVGNHLHALLGCAVTDAPRDVALSLLNNLAFAHGMKRVYQSSFYVGTFGPYDHQCIRRLVASQ
jgi:REP element-mobilizing transposase RayT